MDTKNRLNLIYSKTDGYCHLCHKKLSRSNYGKNGFKGAWHIEHSIPKAKGGTDHMNNLFAACIKCNIDKGTRHTSTARRKNGVTRAPFNKTKKEKIKNGNTAGGMLLGTVLGATMGPGGALLGSIVGGFIGNSNSPRK